MSETPTEISPLIDDKTQGRMIEDLYYLIRRHCHSYQIEAFTQEMFLHDSTPIRYTAVPIVEVERFIMLVQRYWEFLNDIVLHLSFVDVPIQVESKNRPVGRVDVYKTEIIQRNSGSSDILVCVTRNKDSFTPENLILASSILGINNTASRFLEDSIDNSAFTKGHFSALLEILRYSEHLLTDRLLRKITKHLVENYSGIEILFAKLIQKLQKGQLNLRYYALIQFIQEWKGFTWISSRPDQSFRKVLGGYLRELEPSVLYEIWIFYRTLSLFQPIRQLRERNVFASDEDAIHIEYQDTLPLGWTRVVEGVSESDVSRHRDVVIRRHGKLALILDAKYMSMPNRKEEEQMRGPSTAITNQMILYLDYGEKCDKGIVVFADKCPARQSIALIQGDRRIDFLQCYPFESSSEETFGAIKRFVDSTATPRTVTSVSRGEDGKSS
jgi:hypothetical protein